MNHASSKGVPRRSSLRRSSTVITTVVLAVTAAASTAAAEPPALIGYASGSWPPPARWMVGGQATIELPYRILVQGEVGVLPAA